MSNPTITTVNFLQSYPVKDVAMPGISICNINKISRRKAEVYADQLYVSINKVVDEPVYFLNYCYF